MTDKEKMPEPTEEEREKEQADRDYFDDYLRKRETERKYFPSAFPGLRDSTDDSPGRR